MATLHVYFADSDPDALTKAFEKAREKGHRCVIKMEESANSELSVDVLEYYKSVPDRQHVPQTTSCNGTRTRVINVYDVP